MVTPRPPAFGTTACYTFSRFGPRFTGEQQLVALGEIAELGFVAVELEIIVEEQIPVFQGGQLDRLRRRLEDLSLTVPVFAPFHTAEDLTSLDPARRTRGLARFEESCRISVDLGCDHLQLASVLPSELVATAGRDYPNAPPSLARLDASTWSELWRTHVDTIARACEIADGYGVRVSIEPRVNCLVANTDAYLRLSDAVAAPNLGVALDPVHAVRSGDAPSTAIARVAAQLFKFEFCDALEQGLEHTAPGAGIFDWAAILSALTQVEYDGPYNVDIITQPAAVPAAYESGLAHLRAVAGGSA
ncbi:MAG: sugar phosphate isomerase/epimerase family protein [Propionicimonas sp.]